MFDFEAERKILEEMESPFIVQLHYAFQTEDKLYFVMDFMNGGELFTHIRKDRVFSESRARFYAAELILGLESLHKEGIIYRDLKPENVILDSEGHLRITDFGLSKKGVDDLQSKTFSFCGTPEYLCPEIIKGEGHNKGADWWSLGALLYEMLMGRPPHYNKNRRQMLIDIVQKEIPLPVTLSPEARSLLSKLLEKDPEKRLGSGEEDAS